MSPAVFGLAALTTITASVMTDDCEVYLGGSTYPGNGTYDVVGSQDAWVAKIDADGQMAWRTQWGATGTQYTSTLIVRADGSVTALGPCSGQAPKNPASSKGFPFVAQYAADGELLSVTQTSYRTDFSPATGVLELTDGEDQLIYEQGYGSVLSRDSEGLPSDSHMILGKGLDDLDQVTEMRVRGGFLDPVFDQSSASVFSLDGFGPFAARSDVVSPPAQPPPIYPAPPFPIILAPSGVWNFAPSGELLWIGQPAGAEKEIDPVEGVIWKGSFSSVGRFVLTKKHFYLAGSYTNQYENGSVLRPKTTYAFVAQYDLKGKRLWFQGFMLDRNPLSETPVIPESAILFVPAKDDKLSVVFSGARPVETATDVFTLTPGWTTVELDTASGELL